MADKKISQLPAATTPLAGTEVLPIVQSSTTDQVSVANLTAGRVPAMNNAAMGFTSTASAAGTTTLTATSNHVQKLTGSTTQTYQLPDATTMTAGTAFIFDNDSTGLLTVVDNASGAVTTVASGSAQYVYLMTNATAAGTWGKYSWVSGAGALAVTTAKSASITNSLTLSGTDSTTMTFPTTSASIARTDAAQTFTGNQSITGTLATTGNLGAGIASPTVRGHFATDNAETKIYAQRTQSAILAGDILGSLSFVGTDSSSGASGERVKLEAKSAGVFGQTDFNLYASNTNAATLRYTISGIDGANYWYGIDGTTLRMSLDSTGNQTLATGNLVIGTSGKGIDFSATASGSGTMTSELLADYEEGTFTPALAYGTAGTSSFTYSNQTGKYIKIGRMVYFATDIRLSAFSKGTASGSLYMTNLPYTPENTSGYTQAQCTVNLYNWTYTSSPINGTVVSAATNIALTRAVSGSTSQVLDDPSSNSIIWITGSYFAAS